MIRAGHCTKCGTLIWRTATAQRDWGDTKAGEQFLLWPKPESVYARFWSEAANSIIPGVAYCRPCVPAAGTDGPWPGYVMKEFEPALSRYSAWYAAERRGFYQAWLQDQLYLDLPMITALLLSWDQDRAWAEPDAVPAHA